MTFIDKDKLEAFIKEGKGYVKLWTGTSAHGARDALDIILSEIGSGKLDAVDTRTPVDQITVPSQTRVRSVSEGTSFQAAIAVTPEKAQRIYNQLMYFYQQSDGLTDDEMLERFKEFNLAHSPSGLRARRSELRDKGWVRDSGKKRPSNSGHSSIVWERVS